MKELSKDTMRTISEMLEVHEKIIDVTDIVHF